MKCIRCGTDNPAGKNVCVKCGNFLYSPNPQNRHPLTAAQKSARRAARVKGATLGCLWTFLIVLGVFVFLGVIIFLLIQFVFPPDFIDFLAPATSSVFSTTT
ncbi:MAG: hypothetical protein ACOX1A_05490 [Saccharofermentanales bacterium]|jgi:uncharacterized membrane protein YvbJ|nr:hypothetical protein [Clostridiaceae bacterium]